MIRHLDGAFVAAQVRLIRQVHKGTVVLLEGEDDAKVFEKFLDASQCQIEISFCKDNALDALDRLEEEGVPGVVAIVDADFDRLVGKEHKLENFCLTDLHDLDLTIFNTNALRSYIMQYGDAAGLLPVPKTPS